MKHIVKRGGHTETFDERKLYASIYSVCQSLRESDQTSEMIADKVVKDMNVWLEKKHEVTSHDIRSHASIHLNQYNEDAAWLYKHHRNFS